MRAFKIKTYNNDISKVVQKKLLELGYRWRGGDSNYIDNTPYLFTCENGYITFDNEEGEPSFFNNDSRQEITINDLMEMSNLLKYEELETYQLYKCEFGIVMIVPIFYKNGFKQGAIDIKNNNIFNSNTIPVKALETLTFEPVKYEEL